VREWAPSVRFHPLERGHASRTIGRHKADKPSLQPVLARAIFASLQTIRNDSLAASKAIEDQALFVS